MTEKPPLKPLYPQDWDVLIDDFQYGGARREKWTSLYQVPSLVDLALSSLLKKDFPLHLKIPLVIFLDEFSLTFFHDTTGTQSLDRLIDALRAIVQSPIDNLHITYALKEQLMVSVTSILISIDALHRFHVRYVENVVELLLTLINRPNHGLDRQTRATACECLRELEKCYPCLLSEVAGHLWALCQNERTHASQSYLLLLTTVVYNVANNKLNTSILSTSAPLVPFNVPQWITSTGSKEVLGLNYKELRRAMAFLLEWTQVFTPCAMMEFMGMIIPLAVTLELQASMLKVQFFGMIYSFDPVLCHVVLMMYFHFSDAFDGQEGEIVRRLMLLSKETQNYLVFRLLAVHWLLGLLNKLMLSGEFGKKKSIIDISSRFYPCVFDPLALKALKLDLLARCSVYVYELKSDNSPDALTEEIGNDGKYVVKLFEDGLVSVSALKWLPPWSTETSVAFHCFHKFLIGASSHSDTDPSTTKNLMESTLFHTLQEMLVEMTLEFQRLVPVVVAFVDRLLHCQKHCWLGERLLQTMDERLLSRVPVDYGLVSYFPIFDRIAGNDTVPPHRLLQLLTKFMAFLVRKHGSHTGLKSWSQGSKVLGICRTLMMHHYSSRLFHGLSHLLAFTCLYIPDLEVRDHARIYLRMLICLPGSKLRGILNRGEKLLGISPSAHTSSFLNVQSPRRHQDFNKSRNISSYIHLERVIPLLVKQSWSLSLSSLGVGSDKSVYVDSIRDSEPLSDEKELDSAQDFHTISERETINQLRQPLRVMDSKISEILGTLRRYFSSLPDFRYMPAFKVRIPCILRFDSELFNCLSRGDSPTIGLDALDGPPALYATVLKFSSSAPYGSIPSCHIPFLLGEHPQSDYVSGQKVTLDIVPVENGSGERETSGASVTIVLEPREPTPGLVDVLIETNAENGQIICSELQSINVGIEDMFLKARVPTEIQEDEVPGYYSDLFSALWEACGASSNIGRETFPLEGGKSVAAITGTQSVKLIEVPAEILIQATERCLAPFVVSVIGEQLVNRVKDGGVIRDIIWKEASSNSSVASVAEFDQGLLPLTYIGDEDEKAIQVNISKRNIGCFHILIFLPPMFHLLFEIEVGDFSTLVRIRTDNWPCLAYIDDYLEGLFGL